MSDPIIFLVCLAITTCLLFLTVYFVIMLSDLECDYLNSKACCERLNRFVRPEIAAHCVISIVLLLSWHYILFLFIAAPFSAFLIYRLVKLPKDAIGMYDPAEIRNRGNLFRATRETFIKLGYNLCMFFIYLYFTLYSMIASNT